MSPNLYIVVLVFSGTMLVNVLTSAALWYIHGNRIFGYITLSWVITSINFFLQSQFVGYDYSMLLAFSFYVLASWVYYEITSALLVKPDRRSWVYTIPVTLVILGLVTLRLTQSFRFASIFSAIAIAMPLLVAAWKARSARESRGDTKGFKILALLLVLLAIHYLDYPFLRQSETGAVFGFTFAFLLTFAFSIFFPSFLLWQLAAEYSGRLQNEVTKQTKELVDLDNRNKALISILVHDLATPVTTAMMSLNKIEDGDSPVMQRLSKSLRYIMTTIEKVRELQAVSSGKKNLDLKVADPAIAVHNAVQYYAEQLAAQNLTVRFIDERKNPRSSVMIDPQLLQAQIIGNLISNAIKFSPRGEEIVIRFTDDFRCVNIEVIDFGIGIPANIAPKIFSFSGATTRMGLHNEKGTGFGLPLVKAYVDMMNGRIEFKTSYKDPAFARTVGVCMRVRFPLVVQQPILSERREMGL
ncbi:sensor histidine kinase [Bdellovibrio sp. HCB185ZH]|uniref:sensor histidine kinase n=1 Tax=Bdellovibrio sp. HCB185ZH TaxID=3394235 RepID=UPI0039A5739D